MSQVKTAEDDARAEAAARVRSYEGRQILMHGASATLATADFVPGVGELTGTLSVGIGLVALADTGFHDGGLSRADVGLFAVSVIPGAGTAARAGKPLAQAVKATQKGIAMGSEVLATTKAIATAIAIAIAQSKGYDSATVNKGGSITVCATHTGSRIPQTTTCTKDGCK